jgi:hypothetical protein
MTKIFYNTTTGDPAVFDDNANVSDWPNFQTSQPDMTPISATQVRSERDELLAASDHMALADRITDGWRTYRQALRDVPAQTDFPNTITWPTKPS